MKLCPKCGAYMQISTSGEYCPNGCGWNGRINNYQIPLSRDHTEKSEKVNESQIDFLKPCPFCGSDNVHTVQDYQGYWFVCCDAYGCRAEHGNHKWPFERERDAIESWNRRVKE